MQRCEVPADAIARVFCGEAKQGLFRDEVERGDADAENGDKDHSGDEDGKYKVAEHALLREAGELLQGHEDHQYR